MFRLSSHAERIASVLAACALVTACTTQAPDPEEPLVDRPPGFPEQTVPSDNALTRERVALGRTLFYSTSLSRTGTVSCASCHDPARAFTDGLPVSRGVDDRVGTRNAPSLANVGYAPNFLREGGVPTLEMQVLVPIQEHNEFDMNIIDVVERLRADADLMRRSRDAYGRELDAFVVTRSIAAFQRTLVSGRSRADRGVLTTSEERGRALFASDRTSCSGCHGGFLYTNHTFANNGALVRYTDPGRARLTHAAADSAVFRVPSLRNVAVTAPYMHNGTIATLREVVDTYNAGGHPHPNKDPRIRPLGLTDAECADLTAFLESLTDETFLTNPAYRP